MSSSDPLRSATPVSIVLGLGLAGTGAWLEYLGARDASLVQWECAVSTCGTNDLAGAAPILGVLALVLAGVLLTRSLRTAAAPLLVLLGAGSALLGWRSAIDQRLVTAASVRGWLIAVGVVAAVALVVAVVAVVRELRRSSWYWVLLGRTGTWGRVTDYRNGEDGPAATLHFADAAGNRYSVRTRVPRDAFRRPPRVYYDPVSPTDPDRLRVTMPVAPLLAKQRDAQSAAVRRMLPLPGDDDRSDRTTMSVGPDGTRTTTSTGPAGSRIATVTPDGTRTVTTVDADGTRTVRTTSSTTSTSTTGSTETITDVTAALERLAELHRSGALSDAEFSAAKSAVLRR